MIGIRRWGCRALAEGSTVEYSVAVVLKVATELFLSFAVSLVLVNAVVFFGGISELTSLSSEPIGNLPLIAVTLLFYRQAIACTYINADIHREIEED